MPIEFYDEMSEVLLAQTQTDMDEYALPANAQFRAELPDTEDGIYTQLEQIPVDPLNTDWPGPSREDKEQPSGFGWMDCWKPLLVVSAHKLLKAQHERHKQKQ